MATSKVYYHLTAANWSSSDMAAGGSSQKQAVNRARRLARQERSKVTVYRSGRLVAFVDPTGEVTPGAGWRGVEPARKNPASAIPLKWTPARVRVNAKGQVQVALPGRKVAAHRRIRNRTQPGYMMLSRYVVYPSSTGVSSLSEARKQAKEESLESGHARVERTNDQKTVVTYRYGREV